MGNSPKPWADSMYHPEEYVRSRFPDCVYPTGALGPLKGTHANPQQDRYTVGGCGFVHVQQPGRGGAGRIAVHAPENFDPSRTYPMISVLLRAHHRPPDSYRAPSPSASTIIVCRPFTPSRGYTRSHAGYRVQGGVTSRSREVAEDNSPVIGMTLHLLDVGFVDRNRIGLQGQSWRGVSDWPISSPVPICFCRRYGGCARFQHGQRLWRNSLGQRTEPAVSVTNGPQKSGGGGTLVGATRNVLC